jgi:hypothetical protein
MYGSQIFKLYVVTNIEIEASEPSRPTRPSLH